MVFDTMLPGAVQVADPFHLVKLANVALDECRRRVQDEPSVIGVASTTRSTGAGDC